jgi:hypothetical protein
MMSSTGSALAARRLLATLALGLAAYPAHAHHSSVGIYDAEHMVEIEGAVTEVRWHNPHASYTVAVAGSDGTTVDWHVETGSISTLRLRGIDSEFIKVGDRVHLAGLSSLRGLPEMFAQNMLLDNGQELLLRAVAKPYWPAGLSGNIYQPGIRDDAQAAVARRTAHGIFRVWAPVIEDPAGYPLYEANVGPLTAAARETKARWNPRASPLIGCSPKGMPHIMGSAYGLEFVAEGDAIALRLEEFDTERKIHMGTARAGVPERLSPLGNSWGRWQDDTLIVETTDIDTPYFFGDGTPQSRAIRLTEYFTLNEAEDRLDYRLVVNDPLTFTRELEFTRYWVWKPDLRLQPYNCAE